MNNIYWTTRSGVVINVNDMTDQHVRNAFKMLLRNRISPRKSDPFQLNGDIAQSFNDSQDVEDDGCWMMDDYDYYNETYGGGEQ